MTERVLNILSKLDGTELIDAYLILEHYIDIDRPIVEHVYPDAIDRFAELMSNGYSTEEIIELMTDDDYSFDLIMSLIDNCESCNV